MTREEAIKAHKHMFYERGQELNKAIRRLVNYIRDFPEQKDEIYEIFASFEKEIIWMEAQLKQRDEKLLILLEAEKDLLEALQTMGATMKANRYGGFDIYLNQK